MTQTNYGTISSAADQNNAEQDGTSNSSKSMDGEQAQCIDGGETHCREQHGLSIMYAAIFVAGEMAGSGILALPRAIVDTGWIGFVMTVIFCINAAFGGSRLGDCWSLIEDRYPEYRDKTRNPYPVIAGKALGFPGRLLVSGCIQSTLFGAGTVYLLLASRIMHDLLNEFFPKINFCIWFLVFAAALCIPMWLGSPKDFWLIGIGALLTTVLACILIFIQIVIDGVNSTKPAKHEVHSYQDLFIAFGTILFSFGGASTFPTIQNDMVNRNDFYKSIRIAFVVICLLYLPISIVAYFTYGESVNPNVMSSLTPSILTSLANVFMTCHFILAFIILVNPVSQDIEEILKIPKSFCFKRCLVRTLILCAMVFVGETIPKFDKILALVGGSTVTLSTFVLPSLLYMILCDKESSHWASRHIPLYLRTYMWELIVIGVLGGVASTYTAVRAIIDDPIMKPCYMQ